jgi:hypothetical protein
VTKSLAELGDHGLRMVPAGAAGWRLWAASHPELADAQGVESDFAALRARGWAVSRTTLEQLRTRAAAAVPGGFGAPWATAPWQSLFGAPVHIDDEVPDGVLRPIYIERITRP